MFILCQRTDTLPELRTLINIDHVVAVMPVSGGVKSRLYLDTGETWEIALPFGRAMGVFRGEPDTIPPLAPGEKAPGIPRDPE